MFTVTDQALLPPTASVPDRGGFGFLLRPCRCDCWFCIDCCGPKGHGLRQRLLPVLATFEAITMATLTVDPHLFACARAAYDYLTRKRCVSRTVADLHGRGYTHTSRFFSVMEWQQDTQHVHFHVLLDATHLFHEDLFNAWSRHRPPAAAAPAERRPPLGWVWVKAPPVTGDASAAALRAASYLTKVPAGGFPRWVLEMGGDCRIRRYSTSRGFWDRRTGRPKYSGSTRRPPTRRSYAERITDCGSSLNVFQQTERPDEHTGEVTISQRWVAHVAVGGSGGTAEHTTGGRVRMEPKTVIGARGLDGVLDAIQMASGGTPRLLRLRTRRTPPKPS